MKEPVPRGKRETRLQSFLFLWILTWTTTMLLWLLLTSTLLPSEVIGGLAASTIAASATALTRITDRPMFRPPSRWFRSAHFLWLPVQIVLDTGLVFGALARHLFGRGGSRSEFVNVPIRVDRERATSNARDLLTTVRVSMTPNTYVVGIDEDENQMLIHQLVRTHPQSLDELLSPTE